MSGLSPTTSSNSSLTSYNSSIADSTATKNSAQSSFTGQVRNFISRKRSQSLNILSINNSLPTDDTTSSASLSSTPSKLKLLRNKSVSSVLQSSLSSLITSHSDSSTRDNSMSSLSDFEFELPLVSPLSPLSRIDENRTEKKTIFPTERKRLLTKKGTETDIKIYDDIADNILDKVIRKESVAEWNI